MRIDITIALLCVGAVIAGISPAVGSQGDSTRVVRVNASVTDADGKPVTDLSQADFTVLEDGQEQKITRFIKATAPLRIMLVVDTSSSMSRVFPRIQDGLLEFVSSLGPYDEVAVVSFSGDPYLEADFTVNVERVRTTVRGLRLERDRQETTRLYDSFETAMNRMRKQEPNVRTALVLVTDGDDTASREVKRKDSIDSASRSFITVYPVQSPGSRGSITIFPRRSGASEYLKDLAAVTGGEYFQADEFLEKNLEALAARLRHHYVLGYISSNSSAPKKEGRSIEVRVSRPNVKVHYIPAQR